MSIRPKFELKRDDESLVVTKNPKLTRYMIGSYFNTSDGKWYLTTAKFDPSTGAMGEYKEQRVGAEWALLREAHNLAVAKLNLYEKQDLEGENN